MIIYFRILDIITENNIVYLRHVSDTITLLYTMI